MGVVGRLDQYASIVTGLFDDQQATEFILNPNITGLGTFFAAEFSENVGVTTLTANVFAPYDITSGEIVGVLYGAGQGRYMRQNTDKSVIVYNEIDEITDLFGRGIVKDGLVLDLDAGVSASYSGSGTTWTDLSGGGNNFNVNASAYSTTGGIPHMNFEGSFGAAKRVVSGSLSDVPNFSNATIMCFSTILNSTGTWRTLIRGASSDHQVIIQAGGNNLGMYDNEAGGFISAGFDVTTLPNPYTQFNCLTWRLSQSSPYYQFQYNNDPTVYSITNANATFNNGFSVIGAYHGASTGTGSGDSSQYWGKIAVFLYYNRALSAAELQQNYNALKHRFGL